MQNRFDEFRERVGEIETSFPDHPLNQLAVGKLTTSREFSIVFEQTQQKVVDKHFVILATKINQRGVSPYQVRLGLAVQKKKVRRSVDRTYLKRVIRETLRHQKDGLIGWDIVVLVRHSPEVAQALKHRKLIHQSITNSWRRLVNRV